MTDPISGFAIFILMGVSMGVLGYYLGWEDAELHHRNMSHIDRLKRIFKEREVK